MGSTALLHSCNSFLDTKPEDYFTPINYYQDEGQLEGALNAIYSTLAYYPLYGRQMHRMGLEADDAFYNVTNTLYGVQIYDVAIGDPYVADFWSTCYVGINRANTLLANMDNAIGVDPMIKDRVKGEALFLRAYFYFMLVSKFGGVPYISEPTTEVNMPQTPAVEIYQNIIADMELAEGLVLPIREIGHGGRINKSAVRGILARVNLHKAGNPVNDQTAYEEARKWAKMVMDDNDAAHALNPDFSQVFINYVADEYDIAESIWEIEFYGNNQDVYNEGGQIGAYNGIRYTGDDPNYGYSTGNVNASGTLWEKYEAPDQLTSPDLRRDWTIAPFSVSGTPAVETARPIEQIYERNAGKFRRGNYEVVVPRDRQYTPINFPVLRFSDVLLMFAEAENYVNGGPSPDAYEAVNRVRRRAYGLPENVAVPTFDLAGLDQDGFLLELQDERSRELAFEVLRKGDLVRWGIFMEKMTDARNHIEQAGLSPTLSHALPYFRNATARDVLWPIPSWEMGLNSELTQNIGW